MKTHFERLTPSTVQEAVDMLISWMDENDKLDFIMESQSGWLHHGFMRVVRNEWQIWDTSTAIVRNTKAVYGVDHADDISGLIQGGIVAKLKNEPFDYEVEASTYRAHWERERKKEHGLADDVEDSPILKFGLIRPNLTGRVDHSVPNPAARPGTLEAPRKRGLLQRLFGNHY